jgi:hypothetical protein
MLSLLPFMAANRKVARYYAQNPGATRPLRTGIPFDGEIPPPPNPFVQPAESVGGRGTPRSEPTTRLPDRVTKALSESEVRTPRENQQARDFFKRFRKIAHEGWEDETGSTWPVVPGTKKLRWAKHLRALANGGDPLLIEPGVGPDPNAPHMKIRHDGLTDQQSFGGRR